MTLATLRDRRDTAANWSTANPILALGERAWETDQARGKVGDGVTLYNSLPYTMGKFVEPGVWIGKSNGTDDTSTINALITANPGKIIRGTPGETYKVSTITGLGDNQTLSMYGCTVQQIASTNADMLQVASQTAARTLMDGVTTAGSATLTSATANFQTGDVGKTIYVFGAGQMGDVLKTTILSRASTTSITLSTNALVTLSAASFSVGPRTTNAAVEGGVWDKGANQVFVFRFRRTDHGSVRNLRITSSSTNCKYGVNFGDAVDFTVENVTFNYGSDGVHVNGPAQGGFITNISGYTRDDMVSITPNDWAGVNDVYGDVVDVKVTNVDLRFGKNCAAKVLGGSASPLTTARGIRFTNISGSTDKTAQSFGGLVMVGDDTGSANTTGGFCDDIAITNISGSVPDTSQLVVVASINTGTVTIDGVGFDSTTNTAGAVAIGGGTGTIQHAIVRNVRINRIKSGAAAVLAQANVTTKRLTVESVTVQNWQSSTGSSQLIPLGGPGGVEKAEIRNVRVVTSTGGVLVGVNANMQSLLIDQAEINNTSNTAYIVNTTGASLVSDCTISRVMGFAGWTAGYIAQIAATTGGFTRLLISHCHINGVGGSPVTSTVSGSTLGTIIIADSTFNANSWGIGDYSTATNVYLNGVVNSASVNGFVNVRASASLIVRGEGNSPQGGVNLAAGGVWTSLSSDLPFSATAGGLPTLTAGAAAGSGPTVAITGNDRFGNITVNVGTSPTTGVLVTLTFTRNLGAAPRAVTITPTSVSAALTNPYVSSKTATTFVISAQTAPTASAAATFDYLVTT